MILNPDSVDAENGHFHCLTSENRVIMMAVHPVLYGFRVCGWRRGSFGYSLNWCGGAEQGHVEALYSLMRAILLKRGESHTFDGLPMASEVKPFFNDVAFSNTLAKLAGPDVECIKLPPLQECRQIHLDAVMERARSADKDGAITNYLKNRKSQ